MGENKIRLIKKKNTHTNIYRKSIGLRFQISIKCSRKPFRKETIMALEKSPNTLVKRSKKHLRFMMPVKNRGRKKEYK